MVNKNLAGSIDMAKRGCSRMYNDLLSLDLVGLDSYAVKNNQAIGFLDSRGLIDDSALAGSFKSVLYNQARVDYWNLRYPSANFSIGDILMPSALAYGLKEGYIDKDELLAISSLGFVSERYIEENYTSDIMVVLRERLVHPKGLVSMVENIIKF